MESDFWLLERVYGRRADLGFRRYASRTVPQVDNEYIAQLLVWLNQSASLLLCLLVVSKRQFGELWSRCRSMKLENCGVPLRVRSEIPLFVLRLLRRRECRRTAVGLKPLGCTSNDW